MVTNKTMPGDPFVFDVMADYEMEYGGGGIEAVIGGSPTDSVGLRLSVKASDRDGFYENSYTGQDEGDTETTLARATAVFALSDRSTLSLKYEFAERDMDGNTGELFGANTASFAAVGGDHPMAAKTTPWDFLTPWPLRAHSRIPAQSRRLSSRRCRRRSNMSSITLC